jgi:hypothetical protein
MLWVTCPNYQETQRAEDVMYVSCRPHPAFLILTPLVQERQHPLDASVGFNRSDHPISRSTVLRYIIKSSWVGQITEKVRTPSGSRGNPPLNVYLKMWLLNVASEAAACTDYRFCIKISVYTFIGPRIWVTISIQGPRAGTRLEHRHTCRTSPHHNVSRIPAHALT